MAQRINENVAAVPAIEPERHFVQVGGEMLGAFEEREVVPGKVFVNLAKPRFLLADVENDSGDVFPSKEPECLQPMQARYQMSVTSYRNRVQQSDLTDALDQR